jgi:hypothetical protein
MGTFLAIVEFIKKILDFVTPWSSYWVDKKKKSNEKKDSAQKAMDDAASKGDRDAYWNANADKHNA